MFKNIWEVSFLGLPQPLPFSLKDSRVGMKEVINAFSSEWIYLCEKLASSLAINLILLR